MSIRGYVKKWPRRAYLGPAADAKRDLRQVAKRPPSSPAQPRRPVSPTKAAPTRSKPSQTTLERRAKKRRRDRLYHVKRKEYLARPENMWDQVELNLTGILKKATHVHHVRGRHRTLLFDERFFCPTRAERDLWPHENIEAARKLGLIAQAGDWRREPGDAETKRIESWMREQRIW